MTKIDFPGFPGLDFGILKFHDFPGFPGPVRTLSLYTGNILNVLPPASMATKIMPHDHKSAGSAV